jgi:SNF2 family DNA or RNA helicase
VLPLLLAVAYTIQFTGSMGDTARKLALDAFQRKSSIKILIMGLRCGGQALNITHANRVIIVDPWWNKSVEMQAFGRVFRYAPLQHGRCVSNQ